MRTGSYVVFADDDGLESVVSLTRWGTRRDRNEPEIRKALMDVGAEYIMLDAFDLLVLFRGRVFMLDVKAPKRGRTTASQQYLVDRGWPLIFVRSVDEALQAIGAVRA